MLKLSFFGKKAIGGNQSGRKWIVFIFCLLLIVCQLYISCQSGSPVEDDESFAYKESIVQMINDYRRTGCDCGSEGYFAPASPVIWNDTLANAAKVHSTDMSANNFLNHTGSDGSSMGDRIKRLGYNMKTCGENIAKGYKNDKQVIQEWMKSPGHCRNIMIPYFKEIGFARVGDCWTLVLGER